MSGSSHRQQTCYWLRPPHIRRDGPFPIPVMPCSTALPTPFGGFGLRGYRKEEDALNTIRGRNRFREQIGRRFGLPLPTEVVYDEFTEDIEQNRLLKTAIDLLGHTFIRSDTTRRELRGLRPAFDMVMLGTYVRGVVPEIRHTRLDEHYRPAVDLARLVIENCSLELLPGEKAGAAFLMDMNRVFERFLYVSLGEALSLTSDEWKRGASLKLDQGGIIDVEPDFSWWSADSRTAGTLPCFVGDAKYKKLNEPGFRHGDIYQMLGYCTAADLPSGLLIYASGEGDTGRYRINHTGKTIEVESIDLSSTPTTILREVDRLAERVRVHAQGSCTLRIA